LSKLRPAVTVKIIAYFSEDEEELKILLAVLGSFALALED